MKKIFRRLNQKTDCVLWLVRIGQVTGLVKPREWVR